MAVLSQILSRGTVLLIELVLRALPPRALVALLEGAGSLWFTLSPGRRRVAYENLRIALGEEIPEAERRRIARASFRQFGRAAAELILAPRLFATRGGFARRVVMAGDIETARAWLARGEPGLLVTAHFGSWEVASYAALHHGAPLRVVVRTLDDGPIDAFITRCRGGEDRVIRKRGAVRGIFQALRERRWVGILSDQNAGRHGVFVPFFGVPASTVPVPAVLSRRTGTPIYLGFCVRRPGSALRYEATVERLPDPPAGLSDADHIEHVLTSMHARFEHWIRAHPEQYNWSHRRWKTRPMGEEPGPRTPAYGAPRPALRPRERAALQGGR